MERFTKLFDKHRLLADPQNVNLIQEENDRKIAIAKKIGGDMMNKVYTDVKKMCHNATPTDAKIKEVADRVAHIFDKQNEIIRKLTPAAAHGEGLREAVDEI